MRRILGWALRILALGAAGVLGGAIEEHFFPPPPNDDADLIACQRQSFERGEALIHAVGSANQANAIAGKCLTEYKAHLAADLERMGARP